MERNELIKKHAYYNNAFFKRWAGLYDYEKYLFSPLRRKAAQFLDLKTPVKILDVATGTGAQAYELAKRGFDVTGVDLSPEMLQQAKKKLRRGLKLRFLHADGTKLPFKDNEFAAASISLGLHDMPYEIDLAVLKEMKRVVRKKGKILIVDYNEPRNHLASKIAHHIIRHYETKNYDPFIRRGLRRILQDVGLTIARRTDFWGVVQIVVVTL